MNRRLFIKEEIKAEGIVNTPAKISVAYRAWESDKRSKERLFCDPSAEYLAGPGRDRGSEEMDGSLAYPALVVSSVHPLYR